MAAKSDGSPAISYSCMLQPRLIKQLKTILSEYPDGDQILKELIQNAEDAEATVVHFLFDQRRINDIAGTQTKDFTRFFKGPALCVYNDGVFTDKDWKGIQMIYSSIKEEDPLKVGRFGLGFKSVFHITDYPCVLSGSKFLMIDPFQPEHMVNATVELLDIENLEEAGFNPSAFWDAFEGMFGLNKECIKNGVFKGTIFRFPLREKLSELSGTLYDSDKVTELFEAFSSEASCILLFLKSLECITVSTFDSCKKSLKFAEVKIVDSAGNVQSERNKFIQKVKCTSSTYDGPDIFVSYELSIETTCREKREVSNWLIMNYFVRDSASTSFRELIHDDSLGYSPYVSVAAPLGHCSGNFQGHVFCFLPLPKDGYSLTGLPVHVNGYFALSQSRHHIKWETDEQHGKRIDDKSILWNKYLMKEALPRAYENLIKEAVSRSCKNGNSVEVVKDVYQCLPMSDSTNSRWRKLEKRLYGRLKDRDFLFCQESYKWILLEEACFATLRDSPQSVSHLKPAVVRCLSHIGKNYVEISDKTFTTLQQHYHELEDLSPMLLSQFLLTHKSYTKLNSSDKIDILTYLLSDDSGVKKLRGLELLLLESGKWVAFDKHSEDIFACSSDVVKLLPGVESRLLSSKLQSYEKHLCAEEQTQVRQMSTHDFVELLEVVLQINFGNVNNRQITQSTSLSMDWLQKLWKHILAKGIVSKFQGRAVVPVIKSGSWNAPKLIELKMLGENLLVKAIDGRRLPDAVCRCLEVLGTVVLESLPVWIEKEKVKSYFIWPTKKSVLSFLSKLSASSNYWNAIASFNSQMNGDDIKAFAAYLAACSNIDYNCVQLLKHMSLFRNVQSKNDKGKYGSVHETPAYISELKHFPENVNYPFPCLDVEKSQETLIRCLGGKRITEEKLVFEFLQRCYSGKVSEDMVTCFMDFVIENFHHFQNDIGIVNICRNIEFLKVDNQIGHGYKASDLFDPTDSTLQTLLYGDSLMPVFRKQCPSRHIEILKNLGLRRQEDVDTNVILQVAITLDSVSQSGKRDNNYLRKAEAFVNFLARRPRILNERTANYETLASCLNTLNCIPILTARPRNYPDCLEWFQNVTFLCKPCDAKEESLCLLVGSQLPVVRCETKELINAFGWKENPSMEVLIGHLQSVRNRLTIRTRSELTKTIKVIYEHLLCRQEELSTCKSLFRDQKLILSDDGFVEADCIVIDRQTDSLDLHPYFYFLPQEFAHMKDLFETVGCKTTQNTELLLETLHKIKSCHSEKQSECTVRRDKKIVCNILETLAGIVENGYLDAADDEILMMVHDQSPNVLKLFPISQCTYDDDPTFYFELDENVHLVHEMLPRRVVETLGVKSITRKSAMDAEELGGEEWGQKEDLTTRIHALLRDGYTDGLSVPKELIQNADDAGATVIKFLWDERENVECRERVLSKSLKSFQGPAIWVYNDAKFTTKDIKNITQLNAGTKQSDVQKIGKFGLGFCSVYNLTDLPSFVTGQNIVIFDPHETHLTGLLIKRGTGLKYTFPNRTLTSRYIDQFRPYQGIFGCNILDSTFEEYNGTLFRLPLRTELQARESKLFQVSYSKEEVIKLLEMFVKSAANCLLFLQNVKRIELYHLPPNATQATSPNLLFSFGKESVKYAGGIQGPVTDSVLERIPLLLQTNTRLLEIHRTSVKQKMQPETNPIIASLKGTPTEAVSSWIISWATGQDKSLEVHRRLSAEGSVPLAAVAYRCASENSFTPGSINESPLGFYRDGHLFCFLPLPVKTCLQIHINGCFAVTSDRRQLVTVTDDDKDSNRNLWNKVLLEDAVVKSIVYLCESLSQYEVDKSYQYYHLWPRQCSETLNPFKCAFYKHIIEKNSRVFKRNDKWLRFEEVIYLDPSLRKSDIGDLAFDFMSQMRLRENKTLIELPDYILDQIRISNTSLRELIDQALVTETEFLELFLENVHDDYWAGRIEDRNKLILRALKCSAKSVARALQKNACIPTEPAQTLKTPGELINPASEISSMFDIREERFPLSTPLFRSRTTLAKLIELGMHSDKIPPDLFLDRCKTVATLAKSCCSCAKERSANILQHMSHEEVLRELEDNKTMSNEVKGLHMIPVLMKPKHWKFSWKAEVDVKNVLAICTDQKCNKHNTGQKEILIGRSRDLVTQNLTDYVGIVSYVADDETFAKAKIRRSEIHRLLNMLGISAMVDEIPLDTLISQTTCLVQQYNNKSEQFDELQRIHGMLLNVFDRSLQCADRFAENKRILEFSDLIPLFLVGDDHVEKNKLAFDVKEEVKPYIYKMSDAERRSKENIYRRLGVKNTFSVSDIVCVMQNLRDTWEECVQENILKIGALLRNLEYTMTASNLDYNSIMEHHDHIYAPDLNGELFPTYKLSLENDELHFEVRLRILHPSIAPLTGSRVGVKAKELRCFEEISTGISFGQREDLVTRIRGILKAYPFDSGIIKELLQNADDAGATEVHFIKDYRTHSCERIFSDRCKPLQGPSLLVYNNSYFTKKDIEGIHNLGQGSKSSDPTKTGQYGVGFNAVYHLTDTPSFVTVGPDKEITGHLIILDPLCKHVPKATIAEPGQMCRIEDVQRNFPDQLLGFSYNHLITGNAGTIFRFPLRHRESEVSRIVIGENEMNSLLMSCREVMFQSLLFLKSVTCIKVSNITSNSLGEEYSVAVEMADESRKLKEDFQKNVAEITKKNKDSKENNLNAEPVDVVYPLKVKDNLGCFKEWVIAQKFGLQVNDIQLQLAMKNGDLGLLPIGGVAIPIQAKQHQEGKETKEKTGHINRLMTWVRNTDTTHTSANVSDRFLGKCFCFLPLPIETGLPVHVNAHFALDHEARQELWKEGYRQQWNLRLIDTVIIPCWVSGLLYIQRDVDKATYETDKLENVRKYLDRYHSLFPFERKATSTYWKHTAKQFYIHVVQNQGVSLFPTILHRNSVIAPSEKFFSGKNALFSVSWVKLSTSEIDARAGVFDTVWHCLQNIDDRTYRNECCRLIISVMKRIGIRLIETPLTVLEELKLSGIKCAVSSPETIFTYWSTLNDEAERKNTFGPINSAIENSIFVSVNNFYIFLKFLTLDKVYGQKVEGLPLMLTQDGILRVCTCEYPVYSSSYAKLLPSSPEKFIHEMIRFVFDDEQLYHQNILKHFGFEEFCELLPTSVPATVLKVGSEITKDADEKYGPLTSEWLCLFYDFLCDCSPLKEEHVLHLAVESRIHSNYGERVDQVKLREHIDQLSEWSFLPVVNGRESALIPLSERCHVIYLPIEYRSDNLGKALLKLNFPELDTKLLKKQIVKGSMKQCVASPVSPVSFLNCLVYHTRKGTAYLNLSEEDASEILAYFSRNLSSLEGSNKKPFVSKQLRQLPLYKTLQRTLTSIKNGSDVFVLPSGMPIAGIEDWATNTQTTLLQELESLQNLYAFLELQCFDTEHVYAEKILPTICSMHQRHWLEHIAYLKDRFGHLCSISDIQKKIIHCLRNVAFVPVNGEFKRVNQLFDPQNPVFACMLTKLDFPPSQIFDASWEKMLECLGLICDVDDSHLIRFAREIQNTAVVDDALLLKSSTLVHYFMADGGKKWTGDTLSSISSVRFILPYKVDPRETAIATQKDQAQKLICFRNSVPSTHYRLCWSCSDLIPEYICDSLCQPIKQQLCVQEEPEIEKVILHCQNVVDSLKEILQKGRYDEEFIYSLMSCFYKHFQKNIKCYPLITSRLRHKPIIHIPEEKDMVLLDEIVIDLHPDLEITPYLFRAPKVYGQFHKLFEKLGSETEVKFCHYSNILNKTKAKSGENQLTPQERLFVQQSLLGMLALKISSDDSLSKVKKLYLPNKTLVLKDARTVVFSDNPWLLHRIRGHLPDVDFFVERSFLDLSEDISLKILFGNLPDSLRPIMLSSLIQKTVRFGEIDPDHSLKATVLERFLHSQEFLVSVCRLLKNQLLVEAEKCLSVPSISELQNLLLSINIIETSSLKSYLVHQGQMIPESEMDIYSHVQCSANCVKLYFKDTSDSEEIDMSTIEFDLISAILKCIPNLSGRSVTHLTSLLRYVEEPEKMSLTLDKLQIPQYGFSAEQVHEYFPKPGTRVEAAMIPFLDQCFTPFKKYEFNAIAMELDDCHSSGNAQGELTQIFIYVKILKEISNENARSDLLRRYEVRTGNPNLYSERVPIFRLYRFVRRQTDPGRELQRYDEEPIESKPLDEHCRRIRDDLKEAWQLPKEDRKRIVRRLLFKWHPDKNLGNEDYCNRVFQYIRVVISRLENGEEIVDNVAEEMARGPSQFSTGTAAYYDDINTRAQTFARAYYDNWDSYNRAERTGRYTHSHAEIAKVRDYSEAQRWLRQAKKDFQASAAMFSVALDVEGFNWVCYTCHQACEKALKAVIYSRDANNVPRSS